MTFRVFKYHSDQAGRGPLFVGLAVLVPLLVLFALWATLAPLNAAAIAPGEIILSSDRKTVQHLEGGLVTEIFVREGESVSKGQPLLVVQDLEQRSQKAALSVQLVNLNAQIARLVAERDGMSVPSFEAISTGVEINEATTQRFAAIHRGVFENMTGTLESAEELAASRKIQIGKEIEGLQAQLAAKKVEAELVLRELKAKQTLQERGIVAEIDVNALARAKASLDGEMGSLAASIAQLEQSILDQDVEMLRLRNERSSTLLGELQEAQISVENIRQELRTLQDRQDRAVIRAPASGVVLEMRVHTIGAVLSPGTPLMDIIPQGDDLIIEARVNPTDIDLVAPGMGAQVQLSAYKAKKVDKLDASVENISGDIVSDETTGERFFLARLRVNEEELLSLPSDVELSPGMPADVFMIAGERTMADYLLSPIMDAAYRSFRED